MSNALQTAFAPQGKADQRVYTPVVLIERVLLKVWPEGIAYDPFPGDMAPVTELAESRCRGDGYLEPLVDRSYGNPPFARLKEAMQLFQGTAYAQQLDAGLLLLGPAQTHRTWFWECRGEVVAWLRPLKFHCFEQTYPKPLCLHYWGERGELFADVVQSSGLAVHVGASEP